MDLRFAGFTRIAEILRRRLLLTATIGSTAVPKAALFLPKRTRGGDDLTVRRAHGLRVA